MLCYGTTEHRGRPRVECQTEKLLRLRNLWEHARAESISIKFSRVRRNGTCFVTVKISDESPCRKYGGKRLYRRLALTKKLSNMIAPYWSHVSNIWALLAIYHGNRRDRGEVAGSVAQKWYQNDGHAMMHSYSSTTVYQIKAQTGEINQKQKSFSTATPVRPHEHNPNVCVCVCVCAVSYTHLTLPTRRWV